MLDMKNEGCSDAFTVEQLPGIKGNTEEICLNLRFEFLDHHVGWMDTMNLSASQNKKVKERDFICF